MKRTLNRTVAKPINNATVTGILASIYREILFDLGITGGKFNMLLEQYVRISHKERDSVNISNFKNALKKELLGATMTWKVFMKGLGFLSVVKLDLTLNLTYKCGNETLHKKTIHISGGNADVRDASDQP